MNVLLSGLKAIGIRGGLAIIFLAIALVAISRANTYRLERDVAKGATQILAERLATSNSSIETLKNEMARLNNEAAIRADEYAQAELEYVDEAARLEEQAKASDARIERLNRMAREAGIDGQCVAPESLLRDLEGIGR